MSAIYVFWFSPADLQMSDEYRYVSMACDCQLLQIYRKVSNIRCTKYQNLNVSRLGLQLSAQYIEATC